MVALPVSGIIQPPAADALRGVRLWLGSLILLVFAMVLVGGATRLTESGLSITEWKPLTGVVPPLGEAAWREAFDLYRASPQYDILNRGMSLADFKTIFWWEWAHRELGRFIGFVYLAGFLWFAFRRAVPTRLLLVLAAMGLLLAMQGLVGWIMVASGLEPGMTAVAPIKLTLHLTLACLFFAGLVALFVRLGGAAREPASAGACWSATALVLLAFIQIALGGLVAGHDAGLAFNTWPLMDGRFFPAGYAILEPAWLNPVDNVTAIQFNHRIGAYSLAAFVLAYAVAVRREGPGRPARALLLAALVLAQVVLGIATLVQAVPIGLALAHQGLAMILLLALVWNASVLTSRPRPADLTPQLRDAA
jgi:cytochrome c oxidase assembly protein subunit 15